MRCIMSLSVLIRARRALADRQVEDTTARLTGAVEANRPDSAEPQLREIKKFARTQGNRRIAAIGMSLGTEHHVWRVYER